MKNLKKKLCLLALVAALLTSQFMTVKINADEEEVTGVNTENVNDVVDADKEEDLSLEIEVSAEEAEQEDKKAIEAKDEELAEEKKDASEVKKEEASDEKEEDPEEIKEEVKEELKLDEKAGLDDLALNIDEEKKELIDLEAKNLKELDADLIEKAEEKEGLNKEEKEKETKINVEDNTITVYPNSLSVTFNGQEHGVKENYTVLIGDKKYTLNLTFEYTKDSEAIVGKPVHVGDYTATLKKAELLEDGADVTENYKIAANDATVKISPRTVTVKVEVEKVRVECSKVQSFDVGYSIVGIEGNLDDSEYRLDESMIVYEGDDHIEYVSREYSSNQAFSYTTKTLPLDSSKFKSSNEDYALNISYTKGNTITLAVYSMSNSPKPLHMDVYFQKTSLPYNGQTQSYRPTVNGSSERYVTINTTIQLANHDNMNLTIVVDAEKLRVSGKDVGTYYVGNGDVQNAIVSATSPDGFDNKEFIYFCIEHYDQKPQSYKENIAGSLTITPAPLYVYVTNDAKLPEGMKSVDIRKNYGEEDPDRSTWVYVNGLFEGDSILDYVNINRELGEDVIRNTDGSIGGYRIFITPKNQSGSGSGDERPADRKIAKSAPERSEAERVDYIEAVAFERIDEIPHEYEEWPSVEYPTGGTGKKQNYTLKNASEGYLYIDPIPVTITAEHKEKMYGTKDPKLTYVVSEGLVKNEVLPEGFVGIDRIPGEDIGTYPIQLTIYPKSCDQDKPLDFEEPGTAVPFNPVEKEKEVVEAEQAYKEVAMKRVLADVYEKEVAVKETAELKWEEERPGGTVIIIDKDPIDDTTEKQVIINPNNYDFHLVDSELVIKGTTPITDPDPDDPEPTVTPDPTPDPDPIPDPEPAPDPEPTPEPIVESGPVETIDDTPVPMAAPGGRGRAWALLNLICAVLTVLCGLSMFVGFLKGHKDEEEEEDAKRQNVQKSEEEEEENKRYRKGSKLLGILVGIVAVIAFILTEDMRLPMVFTDRWTLMMIIILAINLLVAWFTRYKDKDKEDDDDSQTPAPAMS